MSRIGTPAWLGRAYELGDLYLREIDLDPIFVALHTDPRFERIMADVRAYVAEMGGSILSAEAGR